MVLAVEREAEEVRDKRKRLDVVIDSFKPNGTYQWKDFAGRYKTYKKALEYNQGIQGQKPEDNPDIGALEEFGKLIHGNGLHYFDPQHFNSNHSVKYDAQKRMQELDENFTYWAVNNRKTLLNRLKEEDAKGKRGELVKQIVLSVPIASTDGDNSEHDYLVKQINRYHALKQISELNDPNQRHQLMMREIDKEVNKQVNEEIKGGRISPTSRYLMNTAPYKNATAYFMQMVEEQDEIVNKILTPERAEKILDNSMRVTEEAASDKDWAQKDRRDMELNTLTPLLRVMASHIHKADDARKSKEDRENSKKKRLEHEAKEKYKRMNMSGW